MKIGFLTIHVQDLEKSVTFYEKVFDFKVVRRFKAGPKTEIVFMDDKAGNLLEFIEGSGKIVKTEGLSIGFDVEDIEKMKEHLLAHGVQIISGPTTTPSGVKLMNALDINGVELGFVEGH
ncbi:MAG: VOC family protein [bacterium]